jgi:nicotinamide phosphoribosyltransferase
MSHPLNNKSELIEIPRKNPLRVNPLKRTDSYKPSHFLMYPDDMEYMEGYFESRGGLFAESTVFGLQALLHTELTERFTHDDVEEAATFFAKHGEPFNAKDCHGIVDDYGGNWPVEIRSIPEGLVVPTRNLLFSVHSTDPKYAWVPGYLETQLCRLWYPSTIAIQSREFRKCLKMYLDLSSDTPDADLPFAIHDFAGRGVTCGQQAQIGGAGHAASGAMGSDTVEGIDYANYYYDCDMSMYSIIASEHSVVCSWTREKEFDFYRNFVKKCLTDRVVPQGMPKLAACVSDTYNIFDAVKFWCSAEMRQLLKDSGGRLVIRPDSGEPVDTLTKVFALLETQLGDEITINSKGYKVLPNYLRIIQGDGIDLESMGDILSVLVNKLGWSATNIAFGSGGGLLQKVNRDTQRFAFKACAVKRSGKIIPISKDPITDKGKRSKEGRLDLVCRDGKYETIVLPDSLGRHPDSLLNTVYRNGKIYYHNTLEQVRGRMSLDNCK